MALALFMIFSGSIFQAAAVHADDGIVASIAEPNPASFSVKKNVEAENLNLPSSLTIEINGKEKSAAVSWTSRDYAPAEEGTYTFTSAFQNADYKLAEGVTMPSIKVTVTDEIRYQIVSNLGLSGLQLLDTKTNHSYYTYCLDPHLSWPSTENSYFGSSAGNLSENELPADVSAVSDELTRLLFAGYPTDALGLSDLPETKSAGYYAYCTQAVIWAVMCPDDETVNIDKSKNSPYAMALYEYAMTGTLSGEYAGYLNNLRVSSVTADQTVLKDLNNTGDSASFALSANRNTLAEVTEIPANCQLFDGTKELLVGSSVSVSDSRTLTLKKTNDEEASGSVKFRYVSQTVSVSGDNMRIFTVANLNVYKEGNKEGSEPYQRMIGYEIPTSYNTISIQVINKNAGDLTVAKTVQGEGADTEKEFSFQVTLSDSSIQGTYGSMVFEDGIASFRLKHGESMTAVNLPANISYTVSEEDYSDQGYKSESKGAAGSIENDIEKKASFINTYTPAAAPIETPKPTETPTPTETPKPTETPAPSPSASPRPTTPETPYHIDISGFKIPNTAVKN
jgi:hypothetical protein